MNLLPALKELLLSGLGEGRAQAEHKGWVGADGKYKKG